MLVLLNCTVRQENICWHDLTRCQRLTLVLPLRAELSHGQADGAVAAGVDLVAELVSAVGGSGAEVGIVDVIVVVIVGDHIVRPPVVVVVVAELGLLPVIVVVLGDESVVVVDLAVVLVSEVVVLIPEVVLVPDIVLSPVKEIKYKNIKNEKRIYLTFLLLIMTHNQSLVR